MLDNFLIKLFHEGRCLEAYKVFGAHPENNNGNSGVRFTVYAPNAKEVQVIGDFNKWDGSNHVMERYTDGGIYTLFIEGLQNFDIYKYRIITQQGTTIDKADPYAFFSEVRPGTASRVFDLEGFNWRDEEWLKYRTKNFDRNMNIYEVNLGSWKLKKEFTETEDGVFYNYEELIDELIPYVVDMGYTHIEVMPLNEFPFDGSWGYQATGYFSATSRYGTPKQLMKFIDACHENGIGVIMDFVPAHFVKDAHGLMEFDGGYVYEYNDINRRYTEWDSCYFDFGKDEVRSFLMSSCYFWTEKFHIDGLRFDAISNLIYWKGNKFIGVNDGAIEFMQRMTNNMNEKAPSVMLIAEDSTDYPGVTRSASVNGLGFDYKWDLGWMNDTLRYFKEDPVYRQYDHNLLTFSMMYFYSENFILEFSHDEVVHGKGTILDKMWGNNDQKFAQAKALYIYMMTHPGKKLNFMGNELAEYREWDEKKALGWNILKFPQHDSFHRFIRDLNHIVMANESLYQYDYYPEGFRWLVVDDKAQSVFSYARIAPDGNCIIVVANFVGNTHSSYTIPVPFNGSYKEILNSDTDVYSGNNFTNPRAIRSKKGRVLGEDQSIIVRLAPFSAAVFEYRGKETLASRKAEQDKEEALEIIRKAKEEIKAAEARVKAADKLLDSIYNKK